MMHQNMEDTLAHILNITIDCSYILAAGTENIFLKITFHNIIIIVKHEFN